MHKSSGIKIKETPLQIQIVHALRLDFLPEDLTFTHCPSGGKRDKRTNQRTGQEYSPEGRKLKAMGLLPGVPDLLFWWPIAVEEDGKAFTWMDSGFIEIKTSVGELSPEQIEFLQRVKAMGAKYAVARDYETVRDALISWGVKCQNRVKLT